MPLLLSLVLAVYGVIAIDGFLSVANLVQVVRSQSIVGIAAIGMTFIVVSGNFVDLSVPAVIAVSANLVLTLDSSGVPAGFAVALAVGVGVLIGASSGVVVSYLGVNSVIATLGVGSVAAGLLLWRTGGALSRGSGGTLNDFARANLLGVPVPAIVFVALIAAAHIVLEMTRFGASIRATGGNSRAARIAGVRTTAVSISVFVIMGACAAVAGALLGAFANQADVAVGTGYELDALIAVVLGGTLLTGGVGGFGRTFLGLVLIGVVNNILLLQGMGTSVQLLTRGTLFIAVVVGNRLVEDRWGAR
jgi:ribose transport system permease protein